MTGMQIAAERHVPFILLIMWDAVIWILSDQILMVYPKYNLSILKSQETPLTVEMMLILCIMSLDCTNSFCFKCTFVKNKIIQDIFLIIIVGAIALSIFRFIIVNILVLGLVNFIFNAYHTQPPGGPLQQK